MDSEREIDALNLFDGKIMLERHQEAEENNEKLEKPKVLPKRQSVRTKRLVKETIERPTRPKCQNLHQRRLKVLEFLKNHPCLWDNRSSTYKNKRMRTEVLVELKNKFGLKDVKEARNVFDRIRQKLRKGNQVKSGQGALKGESHRQWLELERVGSYLLDADFTHTSARSIEPPTRQKRKWNFDEEETELTASSSETPTTLASPGDPLHPAPTSSDFDNEFYMKQESDEYELEEHNYAPSDSSQDGTDDDGKVTEKKGNTLERRLYVHQRELSVLEFLKNHPCLWNKRSSTYNKRMRNEVLVQLKNKFELKDVRGARNVFDRIRQKLRKGNQVKSGQGALKGESHRQWLELERVGSYLLDADNTHTSASSIKRPKKRTPSASQQFLEVVPPAVPVSTVSKKSDTSLFFESLIGTVEALPLVDQLKLRTSILTSLTEILSKQ